jgi:hypothetical protein
MIDGGRSQILRQHFPGGPLLTLLEQLMVGAPGSSDITSQGAVIDVSKH